MRKIRDGATLPSRAHEGDAGLDLYACELAHIGPGERWGVGTGVAVEVPPGHAGLVLPRSGLAREHGIALVNSPGLIDSGYRGELRVLLLNTDPADTFHVGAGGSHRAARLGRGRDGGAHRGFNARGQRSWRWWLRLQRPLSPGSPARAIRRVSGHG